MSDAQIFQILSLVYIAVGIGILINPGFYKKLFEDFVENASVLYLGGITALVVGYLILAFHNTWTKDYDRTVQSDGEKEYPEDRSHCGHYLGAGILVPRILPEKPNLKESFGLR